MAVVSEHKVDRDFIKRLTQILEERLDEEHFGVSELAEAAGVSRSQLHRKVHAYNGNSTSQFIREYRLQKARNILLSKDETVAEVAYKVGFSSPTYFNTCFKEYYGFSPGEARFHDLNKPPARRKQKRVLLAILLLLAVTLAGFGFYYWSPANSETAVSLEPAVAEISIAVLPLRNWSGDPELEYISDGMTDAIITRLSLLGPSVHVVPFRSVLMYKDSNKDIPAISEELGVQNILQGNFQQSGDQIRISLSLIDGKSNRHFWSEQYSGIWNTAEIFNIQAMVAENVAEKMEIEYDQEVVEALGKKPTENQEAYNSWLKANYYGFKYTADGMEKAIPWYREAIRLDPTFKEAYANLAYLYLFGGASWGLYNEQEAWFKAKELLQRANEIDSTDRKVKSALVDGSYIYEWDFETMEKNYKKHSNVSIIYCLQTGRFEEALAIVEQVYDRNSNLFYFHFKARTLFFLNKQDEAKKLLEFSDDVFSDQIMHLREGSIYYYYMGEYKKSRALFNKFMTDFPERPPVMLWLGAIYAHRDGNMEEVNKYLNLLEERFEQGRSGSPAWFTALYYNSIGDHETAFSWLQKSYNRHEVEMIWLREEPALRSIRRDQRYKDMYSKVGFPMPPHPN